MGQTTHGVPRSQPGMRDFGQVTPRQESFPHLLDWLLAERHIRMVRGQVFDTTPVVRNGLAGGSRRGHAAGST